MPNRAPNGGMPARSAAPRPTAAINGGVTVSGSTSDLRVGYVAVPQGTVIPGSEVSPMRRGEGRVDTRATSPSASGVTSMTTSRQVNFAQGATVIAAPAYVADADEPEMTHLPPLQPGYEYQPVHLVTRDMDLPRVVEDPKAYRPGTPILNWEGPRRSIHPPKLQFWLCITLICVATNVVSGVVPLSLSDTDGQTFLAVWISVSALFVAFFAFMSTTRHLQNITMQMEGINAPSDIDTVLEKLEQGRFSRFEETWKVQVHMIKMFCRLLRHHHGVPATTGNAGTSRQALSPTIPNYDNPEYAYDVSDVEENDPSGTPPPIARGDSGEFGSLRQSSSVGETSFEDERSLFSAVSFDFDEESPSRRVMRKDLAGRSPGSATLQQQQQQGADAKPMAPWSPIGGQLAAPANEMPSGSGTSGPLATPTGAGQRSSFSGAQSQGLMELAPVSPGQGLRAGASGMGSSLNGRRPRVTNADPLQDNRKSWDEVLTAGEGDSEGPSRSLFLQLLKQVKPGQDLSKIVLPVHILEPRSLLEKLSDLFVHPDLVGAIAAVADPTDRMKCVCRWFLSAYHMRPKGVKKPYNPVLGETFECVFARGTPNELWYFAEQVSHHPPITCFRAVHKETKVEIVGSYVPRSKLVSPNTGASVGEGFFDVYIPSRNATYRLGWPTAHAVGVISPPLRLELVGIVKVTSRDDPEIRAELAFEAKPYFGGDSDVVRGGIFTSRVAKYPAMVIKGTWHSTTTIAERTASTSYRKDSTSDSLPETFFDPDTHVEPVRPEAPPTSFPKPSRLVWKNVTVALRASDAEAAQKAKAAIEGHEREIRRAREAHEEQYVPGYFRIVGEVKGIGKDTWRYVGPKAVGSPTTVRSMNRSFGGSHSQTELGHLAGGATSAMAAASNNSSSRTSPIVQALRGSGSIPPTSAENTPPPSATPGHTPPPPAADASISGPSTPPP